MQQKIRSLFHSFLLFLELQLLISIVMLPILIAWGLPISIMTIAGNLFFAQFLTIFIFLSAILFVCDLSGFSNVWITGIMNWFAAWWHYFLSLGSPLWLIGFSSFMFPITCIIACMASIPYCLSIKSQTTRLYILMVLTAVIPMLHYCLQPTIVETIVVQGCQKMRLIKHNNKIYAFDYGALGARPNSQSWIEYTLTQELIKTMGCRHIDLLVVCSSNSRTPDAVKAMQNIIPVAQVVWLKARLPHLSS